MIYRAKRNGLHSQPLDVLTKLFWLQAHVFDTWFSVTPAKVRPLKIELIRNADPIRVQVSQLLPIATPIYDEPFQ